METFILIMSYSVMVLIGLSALGSVLVLASHWLIDNSAEIQSH
ncbi:MAG TPA: hypothetical protein VF168_13030 [Trueperaceae bacterium]